MKISIGTEIIDGPFGGGNEFLKNLINYLDQQGHKVINHLNDNDIDVEDLPNEEIKPQVKNKDEEGLDDFERRLRRIRRND